MCLLRNFYNNISSFLELGKTLASIFSKDDPVYVSFPIFQWVQYLDQALLRRHSFPKTNKRNNAERPVQPATPTSVRLLVFGDEELL